MLYVTIRSWCKTILWTTKYKTRPFNVVQSLLWKPEAILARGLATSLQANLKSVQFPLSHCQYAPRYTACSNCKVKMGTHYSINSQWCKLITNTMKGIRILLQGLICFAADMQNFLAFIFQLLWQVTDSVLELGLFSLQSLYQFRLAY